jgi:hypothetical protein
MAEAGYVAKADMANCKEKCGLLPKEYMAD